MTLLSPPRRRRRWSPRGCGRRAGPPSEPHRRCTAPDRGPELNLPGLGGHTDRSASLAITASDGRLPGKAHCFTSTASSKGIDLTAVANDGTAYGIVHATDQTEATSLYGRLPIAQDGTDTPERDTARVSLRDGKAKALPAAAEVPVYLAADGHGVFRTRNVLAVYPAS